MKSFIPGPDNMPCIWPIPHACIWNGRRYNVKGALKLPLHSEFDKEIHLLAIQLVNYSIKTELCELQPDIKFEICCNEKLGHEGYRIDIDEFGILLQAGTRAGLFYACMTLLQLLVHSPHSSVNGLSITDTPLENLRPVYISPTKEKDIPKIKDLIAFLARYKYNTLFIEEIFNNKITEDIKNLAHEKYINIISISSHDILPEGILEITFDSQWQDYIYGIIKKSCILWWSGAKSMTAGHTFLPDYLETTILQLDAFERYTLSEIPYPSQFSRSFKPVDLRNRYNFPVWRFAGLDDDYNFSPLIDAKSIPNTVPFSIFQGVRNFDVDNALVSADSRWSPEGVSGIHIGFKARSVVFLHSYTANRQKNQKTTDSNSDDDIVGYYLIHFSNGTSERVPVIYGKSICCLYNPHPTKSGACRANAVFTGILSQGTFYTVYSQEWINRDPEIEIDQIDIIPVESIPDGGIAVFGITAVL